MWSFYYFQAISARQFLTVLSGRYIYFLHYALSVADPENSLVGADHQRPLMECWGGFFTHAHAHTLMFERNENALVVYL